MAELDRQTFEVVRRGYDIDQVNAFLIHQAEAWRAELLDSQLRVRDLEGDSMRLEQLEVEVEQSRKQQEALTLTFQTAANARDEMLAKAEMDISERQALVEEQVSRVQLDSEAEVDRLLSEAKIQATSIVTTAEKEANDARHRARMRTDELMLAQEEQLQQRKAELDETFAESMVRYELAEKSMKDKVTELNSMREALVTGLEAIATGGLSALEDVSDELAAVGITQGDDSAVRQLVGGQPVMQEESKRSA